MSDEQEEKKETEPVVPVEQPEKARLMAHFVVGRAEENQRILAVQGTEYARRGPK